jgi:hypothetical protein
VKILMVLTSHDTGAGWVLKGLGSFDSIQAGKGGVASVQWSAGPAAPLRVGDASLARDSLSAQGLCSGISDVISLVRNSRATGSSGGPG